MCTLLKSFGVPDLRARLHVDASAAKSLVERKGLSKGRHIDVDVLWLQEQQMRRRIPLTKCLGSENVADLMAKNLTAAKIMEYSN